MKLVKVILTCCFAFVHVKAMNLKRKVQTPSPAATYYQNIEDFQHSSTVGYKKNKTDVSQKNNCVIAIAKN